MTNSTRRLRHILSANLHAVLDRAEDPAKMLRAVLHEMDEARSEARRAVERLGEERAAFKKDLDKARGDAARWQSRAEAALAAGDEDRARTAVEHRYEAQKRVSDLEERHGAATQTIERLQRDLDRLDEKSTEVRERCRSLAERHRDRRLAARYASPADACLERSRERWDRIQSRLERIEAQIEAYELSERPRLDDSAAAAVEAELEALKQRMRTA